MDQLTLDLGDLDVQSFRAGPSGQEKGGTVHGQGTFNCTDGFPNCEPSLYVTNCDERVEEL